MTCRNQLRVLMPSIGRLAQRTEQIVKEYLTAYERDPYPLTVRAKHTISKT
jgi:hypothetical protein